MSTAIPTFPDGRGAYVLIEKLYAVLAFMVVSGAFVHLLFGYADGRQQWLSDPLGIQITQGAVFLVATGLLFRMTVLYRGIPPVPLPLLLPIVFAVASVYWSIEPGLTLIRVSLLLGTTLVGIYFGARFTVHGFLKISFVAALDHDSRKPSHGLAGSQYGIQPGKARGGIQRRL